MDPLPVTSIQIPPPREGVSNEKETFRLLREMLRFCNRFRRQAFEWDPPEVAAFSVLAATFDADNPVDGDAFRGLFVTMPVFVSPEVDLPPGLSVYAYVPAADKLVVRLINVSAAAIDPPSGTWSFWGFVLPGLDRANV